MGGEGRLLRGKIVQILFWSLRVVRFQVTPVAKPNHIERLGVVVMVHFDAIVCPASFARLLHQIPGPFCGHRQLPGLLLFATNWIGHRAILPSFPRCQSSGRTSPLVHLLSLALSTQADAFDLAVSPAQAEFRSWLVDLASLAKVNVFHNASLSPPSTKFRHSSKLACVFRSTRQRVKEDHHAAVRSFCIQTVIARQHESHPSVCADLFLSRGAIDFQAASHQVSSGAIE
jgi:hypothetical protein